MSILAACMKARAGTKAARAVGRRRGLLLATSKLALPAGRLGVKAAGPLLVRRARRRMPRFDDATRALGYALAVRGPLLAYELGLAEPPKRARSAPRVAAGALLGASAVYFLEPGRGAANRGRVARLVGLAG
jgi:hypothetical protein